MSVHTSRVAKQPKIHEEEESQLEIIAGECYTPSREKRPRPKRAGYSAVKRSGPPSSPLCRFAVGVDILIGRTFEKTHRTRRYPLEASTA